MARIFTVMCLLFIANTSLALDNYNLAQSVATGGLNTAGSTASQSSTGPFQVNGVTGLASKAIDGNAATNWSAGTMTHTNNEAQAWWEVDLGEIKFIDEIKTYNRSDCCSNRAKKFHVFVSDAPFSGPGLATVQAQSGVSDYYIPGEMGFPTAVGVGRTGRYVRVQLENNNYLHMAEVQVIGDDYADPKLDVVKTADVSSGAVVGQTITYTYVVTNAGNTAFENLTLVDDHRGFGTPPVPVGETLTTDTSPTGDSTDATANDGVWTVIGPGDVVTFTGTYVVVQQDIDELQN